MTTIEMVFQNTIMATASHLRPLWQVICHGESCDLCEPEPVDAPDPEATKREEPRERALLERQDAVFDDWRY